ncbi:hypothetical protein AB4144_28345, partial [Rhizobiaceae sp. 2RAB30]
DLDRREGSMKRAAPNITLDDLPMFASDQQIAEAIVGKDNADKWRLERLPTLALKPGFPPIDAFHGGRPVRLVARFYEDYLGSGGQASAPRGVADPSQWNSKSKRRA